jgi:lipid-A-disaccharide synthase
MPRILIVTGEASGDLHGANLAAALQTLSPGIELFGVGGKKMKAVGVRLVQGIERLDVMGLLGLAQIRQVARTYRTVSRFVRENALDAVVFIDNPGLNLRLARAAKRMRQRVIYYIAPQIWAWHASRIKVIKRVVDRMIVILPFEQELYRRAGVSCDFVGHPLLDVVAPSYDRSELRKHFGLDGAGRVVGLLPGSREKEVRALLPLMLEAAARLARHEPGLQFVVAQAASIPDGLIDELSAGAGVTVRILRDQASEVMAVSDLLLVASGTATLQAAVIGTPMVIVYRTTPLTYLIAKLMIRIPWIGLVNIVAGRTIAPELIQQDATAVRLADEAARFLRDPQLLSDTRAAMKAVREQLGEPGASRRAAAAILAEIAA